MAHCRVLDRAQSVLVMIDVQESYRGVAFGYESVLAALQRLLRVATTVDVPILVTEQYPKGLGHTVPELRALLPAGQTIVEKVTMSCCGEPNFAATLGGLHRRQVVVCGLETHACVNQTVHDLLDQGYQVHLPHDALSSRFERDHRPAWEKMMGSGAIPTSVEMIALEWVRTARSPEFKAVQQIIR